MVYAILRSEKLKSAAAIKGADAHHTRSRPTPNAGTHGFAHTLRSPGRDLYEEISERIDTAKNAKRRADSVLAQELMLSASPEYFRPGNPEEAGVYDNEKARNWAERAYAWLKEQFGKNLVSAHVHTDESTPHIHAVVVPLTSDERLSAKEVFSKTELKKMQTSYAEKMKDIGIKRGVENSRATHTRIRDYYRDLHRAERDFQPYVDTPPLMMKEQARREWSAQQIEKLTPISSKSSGFERMKKRAAEDHAALEHERSARQSAEQRARKAESEAERWKAMANEVRDADFEKVLLALGAKKLSAGQFSYEQEGRWHHVVIPEDGKWLDATMQVKDKSAIDLVRHLTKSVETGDSWSHRQAVAWIYEHVSSEDATNAVARDPSSIAHMIAASTEVPTPGKSQEASDEKRRYYRSSETLDCMTVEFYESDDTLVGKEFVTGQYDRRPVEVERRGELWCAGKYDPEFEDDLNGPAPS